jgi:hypothetical protein
MGSGRKGALKQALSSIPLTVILSTNGALFGGGNRNLSLLLYRSVTIFVEEIPADRGAQ